MTPKYLPSLCIAALVAMGTTALHAQSSAKAATSGTEKTTPVPRACNQADLSAYGTPTFAPGNKYPFAGISLAKHQFRTGEPIVIHIWINNSRGGPTNVWGCVAEPSIPVWNWKHHTVTFTRKHNSDIGLAYFQSKGFDLYNDATGRLVLTRFWQKDLGDGSALRKACSTTEGRSRLPKSLFSCSNGPIPIPAHACLTKSDSDFTFDLLSRYDLPAGWYTIRFRNDKSDADDICRSINQPPWHGPKDPNLTFSVIER